MSEARVQSRNIHCFTDRVRVVAITRNVEPTEHYGQRVRDFMQRAGQIGFANRPARRRKADGGTRTHQAKTLLCAEFDRQFFPMTKLPQTDYSESAPSRVSERE